MGKPKILIIEPHGDDAILSTSTIIECGISKCYDVDIATLGHSRDSEGLKKFYMINSIKYYDLPELDYSLKPKINTNDVHRRYKSNTLEPEYVRSMIMNHVRESVGQSYFDEVYTRTRDVIYELFSEYQEDKRNIIVTPYGLDHPYHILVASIVNSYRSLYGITVAHFMYLDKPYTSKRYIQESIDIDIEDKSLYTVLLGDTSVKSEAFTKVYPTERSLLRFTRDEILVMPERYVVTHNSYSEHVFNNLFYKFNPGR